MFQKLLPCNPSYLKTYNPFLMLFRPLKSQRSTIVHALKKLFQNLKDFVGRYKSPPLLIKRRTHIQQSISSKTTYLMLNTNKQLVCRTKGCLWLNPFPAPPRVPLLHENFSGGGGWRCFITICKKTYGIIFLHICGMMYNVYSPKAKI